MFTRDLDSCSKVIAPDSTIIRELLSPNSTELEINVKYSLAHGTIPKGKRTISHRLRHSSETYYILSGMARLFVDNETIDAGPGSLVYVPPSAIQHVKNIGDSDLQYLVICDPAWTRNDVELLEDQSEKLI